MSNSEHAQGSSNSCNWRDVVTEMGSRFTSLNAIPVERATIKRHEWEAILQKIHDVLPADETPQPASNERLFTLDTQPGDLLDEHGRPYYPDMELSWQTYLGNRGPQPVEVRGAYIAAWYAGRARRHAPETPQPASKTSFAWLLEMRDFSNHPIYFSPGWNGLEWHWITTDANEAVTFASEESARRLMNLFARLDAAILTEEKWHAVQHGFMGAAPETVGESPEVISADRSLIQALRTVDVDNTISVTIALGAAADKIESLINAAGQKIICPELYRDGLQPVETGVSEIDRLRETLQRYVEHHEHCAITQYHGVREKSELSRLRAAQETPVRLSASEEASITKAFSRSPRRMTPVPAEPSNYPKPGAAQEAPAIPSVEDLLANPPPLAEERLFKAIAASERLETMSNHALVDIALCGCFEDAAPTSTLVLHEMCSRLHPGWENELPQEDAPAQKANEDQS